MIRPVNPDINITGTAVNRILNDIVDGIIRDGEGDYANRSIMEEFIERLAVMSIFEQVQEGNPVKVKESGK